MAVKFNFNSGESKWLDKPLANKLQARGLGQIEGSDPIPGRKQANPVKSDKRDKTVSKRKTK